MKSSNFWRFTAAFSHSAPWLVLMLVATGHALPALFNASELHSDGAIVGLQARHFLHGEWSWFLWGSGYQTSTDSVLAALAFLVLGATPLALTLSTFLDYLLLVAFAFGTVRRRFEAWPSALLVSPLVFATGPLHTYMFSPPRQASLTLVFASIWLMDGAPRWSRPAWGLSGGALVAGLACFADPYALVFLPGLALFLALSAVEVNAAQRAFSAALGTAGGLIGLVPWWLLTHSADASPGVLRMHTDLVAHNLKLLGDVCLPYLLGTTAYFSPGMPLVEVWRPPAWFHALQLAGATVLLVGIALGGASLVWRRIPFAVRRLAALGAAMLPISLAAFALSVMVVDRLSARYLVAIVLMAPFAQAPLLALLGPSRFAALLAPCLVSTAVAGWLNYGDDVDGFRIQRHDPRTSDEARLHDFLRDRGLSYGIADYWVSYRLTFLFDEQIVIVPWHEALDRYPPYRAAFAAQHRVAYVYDPWRSIEDLGARKAELETGKTEFSPAFETAQVGRYSVLVLQRAREHAPSPPFVSLPPARAKVAN